MFVCVCMCVCVYVCMTCECIQHTELIFQYSGLLHSFSTPHTPAVSDQTMNVNVFAESFVLSNSANWSSRMMLLEQVGAIHDKVLERLDAISKEIECMDVCMYVCSTYVCMYLHMYVCIYICMYVFMYGCMYVVVLYVYMYIPFTC